MFRYSLPVIAFLASSSISAAAEYQYLKCSDLLDTAGASAHVIGWLNLKNLGGTTEYMDFKQAALDEQALTKTCSGNPQLPLYMAISLTFPEVEYEGRVQVDLGTVASITNSN